MEPGDRPPPLDYGVERRAPARNRRLRLSFAILTGACFVVLVLVARYGSALPAGVAFAVRFAAWCTFLGVFISGAWLDVQQSRHDR